mmetsp:Transcript_111007/g.264885  ORF Transcript_111007/g.264885 Transcript_111007/m.264885 type:complete len:200 (-) Transcript_111007:1504-2103(-)
MVVKQLSTNMHPAEAVRICDPAAAAAPRSLSEDSGPEISAGALQGSQSFRLQGREACARRGIRGLRAGIANDLKLRLGHKLGQPVGVFRVVPEHVLELVILLKTAPQALLEERSSCLLEVWGGGGHGAFRRQGRDVPEDNLLETAAAEYALAIGHHPEGIRVCPAARAHGSGVQGVLGDGELRLSCLELLRQGLRLGVI